jgi:hypothetical protein
LGRKDHFAGVSQSALPFWQRILTYSNEEVAIARLADVFTATARKSGEAHTYEFSIRGTTVRGVYCARCTLHRKHPLIDTGVCIHSVPNRSQVPWADSSGSARMNHAVTVFELGDPQCLQGSAKASTRDWL